MNKVLSANTHRLTESDFPFDVTIKDSGHGVISRRKVLPRGGTLSFPRWLGR